MEEPISGVIQFVLSQHHKHIWSQIRQLSRGSLIPTIYCWKLYSDKFVFECHTLKHREQNPSCRVLPARPGWEGIFGSRQTQNARAQISLLLGRRGTGQAEDEAQLLAAWCQVASPGAGLEVLNVPAPPAQRRVWKAHQEKTATETCFHNSLIFSCQMWPEYVALSTLQSRGSQLNQRHSRLSTKKVNIFQRAQRRC